jgi:muconolactone delta-isomerase
VQFLVLTRRRMDLFPAESWTPELVEAEAQRVRELFAAGVIRNAWRRRDIPGAALLMEAATEDEVKAAMESLPLAQLKMLEVATLTQLDPYPGFGPR